MGLILAGILAAAMQAFSADLTSVATVGTEDYFARFRPRSSDRTRLLFGRCAVLGGGALAACGRCQLTNERNRAVYELFPTTAFHSSGWNAWVVCSGFSIEPSHAARVLYVGIAACVVFVTWATLTGPLNLDLGLNFRLNPLLIGILSHVVLFVAGYLASRGLGGTPPELAGLTIWNLRSDRARVSSTHAP